MQLLAVLKHISAHCFGEPKRGWLQARPASAHANDSMHNVNAGTLVGLVQLHAWKDIVRAVRN